VRLEPDGGFLLPSFDFAERSITNRTFSFFFLLTLIGFGNLGAAAFLPILELKKIEG
jgi:hypothetical protein